MHYNRLTTVSNMLGTARRHRGSIGVVLEEFEQHAGGVLLIEVSNPAISRGSPLKASQRPCDEVFQQGVAGRPVFGGDQQRVQAQ